MRLIIDMGSWIGNDYWLWIEFLLILIRKGRYLHVLMLLKKFYLGCLGGLDSLENQVYLRIILGTQNLKTIVLLFIFMHGKLWKLVLETWNKCYLV